MEVDRLDTVFVSFWSATCFARSLFSVFLSPPSSYFPGWYLLRPSLLRTCGWQFARSYGDRTFRQRPYFRRMHVLVRLLWKACHPPSHSFRFVSPRPTAIAIPNICVHTTARSSRMVRPRLDRLRHTLRSRRIWIRVPRAVMRCNAIAAASASTKKTKKKKTCKTRARVRRCVFRRRGRPATPTRSMDRKDRGSTTVPSPWHETGG